VRGAGEAAGNSRRPLRWAADPPAGGRADGWAPPVGVWREKEKGAARMGRWGSELGRERGRGRRPG
jgi:hypothetical protein